MRRIGGGGGGRSFGGSGGGGRSFGGFRGNGSSSTRRVSSGRGRSSSGSGASDGISNVGMIIDATVGVIYILSYVVAFLIKIFGNIGATVVGGILLSGIMLAISVKAGVFVMILYTLIALSIILYSKRVKRLQLDMSFVDDFAGDSRYDKKIIYSREFEAYMLEKLRSLEIIDKKNRIKEGQTYRLNDAFEGIYKDYMKENAKAAAEKKEQIEATAEEMGKDYLADGTRSKKRRLG